MKHQKWLASPLDGSKITRREHFRALLKQGQDVPQLRGPELPSQLAYVYRWFQEVFSGEMITWGEMKAWSQMKGIQLTHWEAMLIRRMAKVWLM